MSIFHSRPHKITEVDLLIEVVYQEKKLGRGYVEFIFFLTCQGEVFQNQWKKGNALYYYTY